MSSPGTARRHVVSASDIGKHYMNVLNSKHRRCQRESCCSSSAVPTRWHGPRSRLPATVDTIKEAAIARYNKFFGYAKNIFLGDSKENSSIQEYLDTRHPEMEHTVEDHVARIKRSLALDDSFEPSRKGD